MFLQHSPTISQVKCVHKVFGKHEHWWSVASSNCAVQTRAGLRADSSILHPSVEHLPFQCLRRNCSLLCEFKGQGLDERMNVACLSLHTLTKGTLLFCMHQYCDCNRSTVHGQYVINDVNIAFASLLILFEPLTQNQYYYKAFYVYKSCLIAYQWIKEYLVTDGYEASFINLAFLKQMCSSTRHIYLRSEQHTCSHCQCFTTETDIFLSQDTK